MEATTPRKSGGKKFALIGALAVVAVGAVAGYQFLFNRSGEAAVALLPEDAIIVVTLDTNPSEQQVGTFLKIREALEREGLWQQFDEGVGSLIDQSPIVKEIRPYATNNFALGLWQTGRGEAPETGAMLIALSDPGAVRQKLAQYGKPSTGDTFAFEDGGANTHATVIGSYLAVSDQPELLARIARVQVGQERSIAQNPAYQGARNALPRDANMMIFLSPQALTEIGDVAGEQGVNPFTGTEWMAVGVTVRPEGLAWNYRCPMDANKVPALKHLQGMPAADLAILKTLPAGAYGAMIMGEPSRYWGYMEELMAEDPDVRAEMNEGVAEFERETGMSIPKDILPAFSGQIALAVYPGPTGSPEDVDGLVLLTDDNGANPAALADKIRALIERKAAEAEEPIEFDTYTEGDATIWRVEPDVRASIEEALGEQGMPGKEPIYAQIGNRLLIGSSQAAINRGLAAVRGERTLADDTAFAGMTAEADRNAQSIVMVSLGRIIQAMAPMLDEGLQEIGMNSQELANIFGGESTGLVISGAYDGRIASGSLFLPMDYDKMISAVGRMTRNFEAEYSLFGPARVAQRSYAYLR